MADQQAVSNVFEYLNSIGTAGLAFIVAALMRGWLVTRREFDACVLREQKLDQRLERALHINDRSLEAGANLAEKLPGKS